MGTPKYYAEYYKIEYTLYGSLQEIEAIDKAHLAKVLGNTKAWNADIVQHNTTIIRFEGRTLKGVQAAIITWYNTDENKHLVENSEFSKYIYSNGKVNE